MPSLFKKRYTEKAFRKKILDRLFVAKDKAWLEVLFKKGPDGRYGLDLSSPVAKEEEKRLKALAKAVKANSGFLGVPKLAAVLVLLAIAAGGYYFFRNLVVEKALEAGLQAVFQARADVRGTDFDLFGARLAWDHLEVADRDRPMKNLFELGPTTADLDGEGLLKLRVVVEKLESRDLRWNTDRKTSGALPGAPEPPAAEKGPGLLGGAGGDVMEALSSFDAKALVDREYDKLAAPKAAEKANAELLALKESLAGKTAALRGKIDAASGAAAEIRSIDAGSIRTVDAAAAALAKVNAALPVVRETGSEADALKRDIGLAAKAAGAAKKELEKAIDADYARIEAMVGISGGDAASLAKGLFADYAEKNLGAWYRYAKRAVEIGRNLEAKRGGKGGKDGKDEAGAPASPVRGRDIPFPTRGALPQFWIREFAFSSASAPRVEGKAADLTGEPDLVGRPAAFTAGYAKDGARFSVDGTLDLRDGAAADADMRLAAAGFPAAVSLPSPVLSIKSLAGPLDLKAGMTLLRGGGMKGRLDGAFVRPRVEREGRKDDIADLAYGVVSGAQRVDISAEYAAAPGGGMDVKLSSSLDAAVKDGMKSYIGAREKKYKAEAKAELRKRLEAALAENETLRAGYADVEKAAGGNLTEAGAISAAADVKKKEIEKRAGELKKQAADSLLKKLPSSPSLPKF